MTDSKAACRLHVLLTNNAEIGIVFHRGPADWWHILKWDLAKLTLKPGAWLKGTLYPTRSAVSHDGKVIAYFAMHGSWDTYVSAFLMILNICSSGLWLICLNNLHQSFE